MWRHQAHADTTSVPELGTLAKLILAAIIHCFLFLSANEMGYSA